jgi:hypothetical protein
MSTDLAGRLISIGQCRVKVLSKLNHNFPSNSRSPLGQLYKVQRLSDMKTLHLLIMISS